MGKKSGIASVFTLGNFLRGLFVGILGGISTVLAMIPIALIIMLISAITGNPFLVVYTNWAMVAWGLSLLLSFSIFGWLVMKFINTIKGF